MGGVTGGIRARARLFQARSRRPAAAITCALVLAFSAAAQSAEGEGRLPDPEFLQFLGETAGVDPELAGFMDTRDARKAIKDAADGRPAKPAPAQALAWDSLDGPSQALLLREKERWSGLEPERQRMLAAGAGSYVATSDTQRAAAHARFTTWRELPARERKRQQEGWSEFRRLAPAQQEALRDAYRQFLELPSERREASGSRWQDMSPEERRRAIHRRQGPKPGTLDKRPCPPC